MSWQRPRNFRLGKMRERIAIQRPVHDDSTGQRLTSWVYRHHGVPASYEPATGTETVRGRQVEANTSAVFLIRSLAGVRTDDRVIFGNEVFGITSVKRAEGGNRYLEVHCKYTGVVVPGDDGQL
jgi:SPP1 family predicted phage head-tail adaptor